jgi:hypothetical protein
MSYVNQFVEVKIGRDISAFTVVHVTTSVDLSRLSPGRINILKKGLETGCISCLSGGAWAVFNILSEKYGFPVFSLSRANQAVISVPVNDQGIREQVIKHMKAMWHLTEPAPKSPLPYHGFRESFHCWEMNRGNPTHTQVWVSRPKLLKVGGILAALGAKDMEEVSPKAVRMEALAELLRGGVIEDTYHFNP